MRPVCLLVLVAATAVNCKIVARLSAIPRPQPRFDLNRYLGHWFVQGLSYVDSWRGAMTFTDFTSRYELEPNNNIVLRVSWRKNKCAVGAHQFIPEGPLPGAFMLRDNIGDVLTGQSIVVATDYDTFAIKWGCPHPCNAPYIAIKTRRRVPGPRTWKTIERILFVNWGLPLSSLKIFSHNNPCVRTMLPMPVCRPIEWWRS